MVDFTDGIDVVVGGAILASHTDNLADNTEFNRSWGDVEHNYDISTADGSHKDITFGADSTYDIAETAVRPAVVYSDKFDVLAGGEVSLDGGNGTYIKEITDDVIVLGIDSVNQTYFDDDKLNAAWDLDTDDGTLRVNWTGYQGGTTRYRDIVVYTGKSVPMTWWDGSANITYYYSDLNLAESLTVAQNKAIYLDTDKDTYFLAPTDDRIDYYVAGQQKLIIGSTYVQVINAELQLTGGDIILDVDGDSKLDNVSDDILAVVMGAGEVGRWDASGYNGVLGATTPAAATVTTLNTSDDVQIGAANGTFKLNVNTDVTVEGSVQFEGFGVSAAGPEMYFNKTRGATAGSHTIVADDDELGQISFYGSDGSAFREGARLTAEVDGTPGASDMPGRFSIWTTADGAASPTRRVTVLQDGNVGIGTASPYSKMHLWEASSGASGRGAVLLTLESDANENQIEFINAATSGAAGIFWSDQNANDQGFLYYDHSNDDMLIGVNGGTAMTLDASGNLGLGVSPSFVLDILDAGTAGYTMQLHNNGGVAGNFGIQMLCGADDGSGQTIYINALDGDGSQNGYIEHSAGGTFQLVNVSDERLKEDIEPTTIKGIAGIRKIEVIDFTRPKSGVRVEGGFSAQQLQTIYPQAVSEMEDGFLGVADTALVAPLVKSVQELDGTMQTFMGRDLERKTELETLREKVEAQGKEIVELQEQLKRAA